MVKASAVSARYAVIAWRTSTVVYHSYRLIYQVAGEETKVNVLAEALTQAVKNRKKRSINSSDLPVSSSGGDLGWNHDRV